MNPRTKKILTISGVLIIVIIIIYVGYKMSSKPQVTTSAPMAGGPNPLSFQPPNVIYEMNPNLTAGFPWQQISREQYDQLTKAPIPGVKIRMRTA